MTTRAAPWFRLRRAGLPVCLLAAPMFGHAQPARRLNRVGVLGISGNSATMAGAANQLWAKPRRDVSPHRLAVSLKVSRALGLAVPHALVLQADEVIE